MCISRKTSSAAPTICFIGVAGSASTTLSLLADGLQKSLPDARLVIVDVERFNTQSTSTVRWTGAGEVLPLTLETLGLRNFARRKRFAAGVNLLLNGGPLAYRKLVRNARSFLNGLRPDLLIACNDTSYVEQALLSAAKANGTRTLLVQEGPFTIVHTGAQGLRPGLSGRAARLLRNLHILPSHPPYGSFDHDLVLACSAAYARRFQEIGVSPARLRVTGVPRFDTLPSARRAAKGTRVLYVFQPFVWQQRVAAGPARDMLSEMAQGLNQAYARAPFELLLRQHPRSDRETLAFFESRLDFPYSYASEGPLPDVLASCACAIGHYSVGLLESVIVGTPVLCVPVPLSAFVDAAEGEKQAWFTTTGVACADTAEGISREFGNILHTSASVPVDIDAEVGPLDRRAVERSVSAIRELLSEPPLTA